MGTEPEPGSYREKLLSVGYISRRSRPRVTERRGDDGSRTKAVTDELDNTVTEHTRPGSGVSHRQDVLVRPEGLHLRGGIQGSE